MVKLINRNMLRVKNIYISNELIVQFLLYGIGAVTIDNMLPEDIRVVGVARSYTSPNAIILTLESNEWKSVTEDEEPEVIDITITKKND